MRMLPNSLNFTSANEMLKSFNAFSVSWGNKTDIMCAPVGAHIITITDRNDLYLILVPKNYCPTCNEF